MFWFNLQTNNEVKAETHHEEVISLFRILQESSNKPDKVGYRSLVSWMNLSNRISTQV